MSTGVYGIVRGADVSIEDMEVFYHYTPIRGEVGNTGLIRLNSSDVLSKVDNPNKDQSGVTTFETLGGMYTLKLPVETFGAKGVYTILIKPVEIRTKITDTGVLSSNADIRGLIFDSNTVPANFISRFENNQLVGYRIEYLTTDTTATDAKLNNVFRIITSNNKAEPVNQNLSNSNQKAIRYRLNDNSSLVFCTISPSSSGALKPNASPFIGVPNQQVIITNTFFDPIMLEVEMVEYDVESLAVGLFGNQTKSLEDGIYTIYNFNNEIYKQFNLFEIKDRITGKPLFEVREQRTNIDFDKDFNNIVEE